MVSEGFGAEANRGSSDSALADEEITRMVNEMVRERLAKDPSFNDKGLAERIMDLGPLGLRLNATHDLVKSVEMAFNVKQRTSGAGETDHGGAAEERRRWEKEKLKASNFPAELLVIGSWKVVSMNEGDLVAKCYFAKRKLVWEVLETTQKLKRKVEIQWSDISAIKATFGANQSGILEVELSQPPTFFQEQNPQPRKHTIWSATKDFTDGQALLHRRHYLRFPPGSLDKHYEKILQADPRLMKLSHEHFPSNPCPFFTDPYSVGVGFSLDFGGNKSDFPPPAWPLYYPNQNQTLQAYPQALSVSPDSVIDYLPIDDNRARSYNHWGSYSNFEAKDQMQIQQQPMITDMSTHAYQNQEYHLATYDESMGQYCHNPSNMINQTDWSNLGSTSSHQFGGVGGFCPQTVDFVPPQANNDVYQMSDFHRNSSLPYPTYGQDLWMEDRAGESSINANSMWASGFHTANV